MRKPRPSALDDIPEVIPDAVVEAPQRIIGQRIAPTELFVKNLRLSLKDERNGKGKVFKDVTTAVNFLRGQR